MTTCIYCQGSGQVPLLEMRDKSPLGKFPAQVGTEPCPMCEGRGYVDPPDMLVHRALQRGEIVEITGNGRLLARYLPSRKEALRE